MTQDQYRAHMRNTLALIGLGLVFALLTVLLALSGGAFLVLGTIKGDLSLVFCCIVLWAICFLTDWLAKAVTRLAADRAAFEDEMWAEYEGLTRDLA